MCLGYSKLVLSASYELSPELVLCIFMLRIVLQFKYSKHMILGFQENLHRTLFRVLLLHSTIRIQTHHQMLIKILCAGSISCHEPLKDQQAQSGSHILFKLFLVGLMKIFFRPIPFIFWPTHGMFFTDSSEIKFDPILIIFGSISIKLVIF